MGVCQIKVYYRFNSLCDKTLTKIYLGEQFISTYNVKSYSVSEEIQVKNLKVSQLAILHNTVSVHGRYS